MLKADSKFFSQLVKSESISLAAFTGRALIILLLLLLAVTLWKLTEILVLLFCAIVLAIGLCAASRLVSRRTGIGRKYALAGVFLVGLVVFSAALYVFGSSVAAQLEDVIAATPPGFKLVMAWMTDTPIGRQVFDQLQEANVVGATGWATRVIAGMAGLMGRGLGYGMIILFVAIYLAIDPERYRQLCLRLVPPVHHPVAQNLLDLIGQVLQRWLMGQCVSMMVIAILTSLGLWWLGIEAPFALGLMGGLFCFIPFVGAILAVVPAALVALTQGPLDAVSVIAMYLGVQFLETNFITPMVQAKATSFPPVLAILSTVVFSLLLGPLGMLMAAPLTLLFMTVIETLYVQSALGELPVSDANGDIASKSFVT
jgi:predicted PurR-regulated permease PerM